MLYDRRYNVRFAGGRVAARIGASADAFDNGVVRLRAACRKYNFVGAAV